ncbi:hypothetical protein C8R44DRAFT_778735 [Mycena epipterygia]|nr:hypothetical protein C8R44DRAFT_778735 [Mycena epipterygia]
MPQCLCSPLAALGPWNPNANSKISTPNNKTAPAPCPCQCDWFECGSPGRRSGPHARHSKQVHARLREVFCV